MFDRANTEHSTLKRLSVMDTYLAEFDTGLRSEIKGQHALRRSVCTLEDQVRELVKGDREENKKLKTIHYRKRPYMAPTAPVAHVDRADPDDPSPRPTRRPRRDDPYVIVRDAATRNEGDDTATTSDPQPPGSPHYHLYHVLIKQCNLVLSFVMDEELLSLIIYMIIMPPRAMTQVAIKKLISDKVAAALAQDRAIRGNTNGAGGSDSAVELCCWFEKTESVFSISECAERNKVKFVAATLQGRALTWWNSQVATLGLEVVNAKSWNDMKIMMREEFYPPEEIQRMEVEL
ncbi:putative reverse transcriptase domain-containing protein [Tanacetum coccineum]